MRKFIIHYHKKNKYDWQKNDSQILTVVVTKPTGEIGKDAQTALRLGMRTFGNLNKVDIEKIVEIDSHGAQVGEDIVPGSEFIIPVGK